VIVSVGGLKINEFGVANKKTMSVLLVSLSCVLCVAQHPILLLLLLRLFVDLVERVGGKKSEKCCNMISMMRCK
jgi:hypothetical protein